MDHDVIWCKLVHDNLEPETRSSKVEFEDIIRVGNRTLILQLESKATRSSLIISGVYKKDTRQAALQLMNNVLLLITYLAYIL